MIKIATWNVNSINVRLPHVLTWLESHGADILAIQETKSIDENFPAEEIEEAGYSVIYAGQKSYNGVAIIHKSKTAKDILTDIPKFEDPQRRFLVATIGDIRIVNVYIPNGQSVGSEKFEYKLAWLESLIAFLKQELKKYPKLVLLGDYNITFDDRDVYDPKAWEGQIHCSEPERDALKKIMKLGLQDSFRLFDQPPGEYSWWDYRSFAFRRKHGLRIDYVLVSEALAKTCEACIIDKEPRGWERPSDHAPVMASFI